MTSRFAVLPTRAIYDKRLTPDLIYVLAGLQSFADKDNKSRVRQAKVGEALGLTRETVNRRMATLMDLGYVTQSTEPGRVSSYMVVMDGDLPAEFDRVTEAPTGGASEITPGVTPEITEGVTQAVTSIPPFSPTVLIHPLADKPPGEHPAVLVYRDTARLWPDRVLRPAIAKTIGDKPEDLERWRLVIYTWIAIGYVKTNVAGMLEHFRENRLPSKKKGGAQPGQADAKMYVPIDKILEERRPK